VIRGKHPTSPAYPVREKESAARQEESADLYELSVWADQVG